MATGRFTFVILLKPQRESSRSSPSLQQDTNGALPAFATARVCTLKRLLTINESNERKTYD